MKTGEGSFTPGASPRELRDEIADHASRLPVAVTIDELLYMFEVTADDEHDPGALVRKVGRYCRERGLNLWAVPTGELVFFNAWERP
jgi:hypothetical protein